VVDTVRVISDGLRSGDLLWSLPLVQVLGPNGRLPSVQWVERCLHRIVDLIDLRLRAGVIHDKIAGASTATAAPSEAHLESLVKSAGLAGDPAVEAIAILYRAYWQASHRGDNQFAVSQEGVFRRLSTYWSGDDWAAVMKLAVEEFERALAAADVRSGPSHFRRPKPGD
jgi:hypothetical protein